MICCRDLQPLQGHTLAMDKQDSGKLLWSDLSNEEKDLVISVFSMLRQWRDEEIARTQTTAAEIRDDDGEGGSLEPDQDGDNSADEL